MITRFITRFTTRLITRMNDSPAPEPDWILATGVWDDSNTWIDTENWID